MGPILRRQSLERVVPHFRERDVLHSTRDVSSRRVGRVALHVGDEHTTDKGQARVPRRGPAALRGRIETNGEH